ncbi:MAG: NTP transferase domain-containing protein [Bacteroidetes bacterium]|nr:NTP transferase domain-containing protein [Bacteroidota bacterium]
MELKNDCAVVILSGGVSRRMGMPKAFLAWDNTVSFLGRIVTTYREFGCNDIVVVLNESLRERYNGLEFYGKGNVRAVFNPHPEYERFYSVWMGLDKTREASFCFLQDVDNPFIDTEILETIYRRRMYDGYVIPVCNGKGGHPVLLSRKVQNRLLGISAESGNLHNALACEKHLRIETSRPEVVVTMNTPEDYRKVFGRDPGNC